MSFLIAREFICAHCGATATLCAHFETDPDLLSFVEAGAVLSTATACQDCNLALGLDLDSVDQQTSQNPTGCKN